MNSLSNGFLYLVGYGWALTECTLCAVAGNWLPFILFFLAFAVTFSVLGCLPLSDAAVDRFGAISAALLAITLIGFTVVTFGHGQMGLGLLKLVGSVIFALGALVAFTGRPHVHHAGCSHGHHH